MNPQAMASHLARRLGLSAEQESQVAALLTSQQAERKNLETNQSITHQQFLAQTKALREQTESRIEALLTDSQKTEYAQMKARRPGPPPAEGEAPPQ
jgi:Na+-transporting NADH:ubiquinone oxidoreductase subunit NqrC